MSFRTLLMVAMVSSVLLVLFGSYLIVTEETKLGAILATVAVLNITILGIAFAIARRNKDRGPAEL